MTLSYRHCEYFRLGTPARKVVGVEFFPFQSGSDNHHNGGLALIVQEHKMDWSSELQQLERGNEHVLRLLSAAFEDLKHRIAVNRGNQADRDIVGAILGVYQSVHELAQQAAVVVSLMSIFWIGKNLIVASVGGCKCYLVRSKTVIQTCADDYSEIMIDRTFHKSQNVLSNAIGMGGLESINDIHLAHLNIQPRDVFVLATEELHQNMSKEEIAIKISEVDVGDACASLAATAIERSSDSASVAVCVVRF